MCDPVHTTVIFGRFLETFPFQITTVNRSLGTFGDYAQYKLMFYLLIYFLTSSIVDSGSTVERRRY